MGSSYEDDGPQLQQRAPAYARRHKKGTLHAHPSGLAKLELWPKALASGGRLRLLFTTTGVAVTLEGTGKEGCFAMSQKLLYTCRAKIAAGQRGMECSKARTRSPGY